MPHDSPEVTHARPDLPPPAIDQWLPLLCWSCERSAYEVNVPFLRHSGVLEARHLRRTDPAALDPKTGNMFDCPYCGAPLAKAEFFPVLGAPGPRIKWDYYIKMSTP